MGLDPGFTREGFAVNLILQLIATFIAFVGAFFLFRKTTEHERTEAREQRDHDLKVRRGEDAARRQERNELERLEELRTAQNLLSEFFANLEVIKEEGRAPLRHAALDRALSQATVMPYELVQKIYKAARLIDQSNALGPEAGGRAFAKKRAGAPITEAVEALLPYLGQMYQEFFPALFGEFEEERLVLEERLADFKTKAG
jgi:hypothetical protein